MSIRVGIISFWHVHAWEYTEQALNHHDTVVAAVWDEDSARGQAAADKLGVPFYASLDDMLASDELDAVIVDAPTNRHTEVILKAAQAGKHIFTEKVIAPTVKEVNEIVDAISKQNIAFTVSLPRLNAGYTLAIQEILDKGLLGSVTYARVRLSHNGALANWLPEHFYSREQCGGGAMIDLGCHPMYLTTLFLGEKVTGVSANFGYVTGKEVEDNAVVTLHTASGAVGVVEAGFVNSHSPFTIEVHGTEGTLLYGTPEDKLLLKSNLADGDTKTWQEYPQHSNRESAFDQWIGHIQNGTEASENVRIAIELTSLMEAANTSAQEGRVISLEASSPLA